MDELAYPLPHIIFPLLPHKTTLILLHGTSSTGPEFAETLLAFPFPFPEPFEIDTTSSTSKENNQTNQKTTLPQTLPSTRLVFPTGRLRPTTVFADKLTHAWFNIHTFTDRTIGESSSAAGIAESINYLTSLIRAETEILRKQFPGEGEQVGRRIVVAGFSQGCAMGVMLVLKGSGTGLGGFVGISGWCPFRREIEKSVFAIPVDEKASVDEIYSTRRQNAISTLDNIIPSTYPPRSTPSASSQLLKIYLTHGKQDEKVRYEWGEQSRDLVKNLGFDVQWVAEEGVGHWYGEMGLRGMVGFLGDIWGNL